MNKPTMIKFFLEHNEDAEITCFFCKRGKCEQSFTVFGDGETRIVGAHIECSERHLERQSPRTKETP